MLLGWNDLCYVSVPGASPLHLSKRALPGFTCVYDAPTHVSWQGALRISGINHLLLSDWNWCSCSTWRNLHFGRPVLDTWQMSVALTAGAIVNHLMTKHIAINAKMLLASRALIPG